MDKSKEQYKERAADYLNTFTTDAGRKVLKDLRSSWCGDIFDKDPYQTAFNMGKRQAVKDIEAMILLGKNPDVIDSLFINPEDEDFQF